MKLKCVISGGQTGADQTGIECAAALGIQTGGTMPKGFRTEKGPMPMWAKKYGLVADTNWSYATRTYINAQAADCTVWFGNVGSPGYYCTVKSCVGKPFVVNPTPDEFRELTNQYETINIAGNRESTNPGVVDQVKKVFQALCEPNLPV